jgi:hypothetical protein
MSQENVERLRLGYQHVNRTGQMIPAEFAQPDFIWDTTTALRHGVMQASGRPG